MRLNKILYISVCFGMMLSFIILMISSVTYITVNTTSENIKNLHTVVVDAGHGGEDGGAVTDDGVLEKDINLAISNNTADLLDFFGYDVVKTRNDDSDLSTSGDTIRSRKISDMKKRLEIFNSLDNNVVISIHQNKFTQKEYNGSQVFYSSNHKDSALLAENIKLSIKSLLQPDNKRECKKADNGIYLLKNAKNPSIIVECGFISNNEECTKLLDETYQKQMAFSIVAGFLNYENSNL